jgi:predicted nucleic acid-binding protein
VSAAFVLDCSVTMSWCFGDEATAAAFALLDRLGSETAVVPSHWFLEVANVLTVAEKRKRMTAPATAEFLKLLGALDIEIDNTPAGNVFPHVLPLCRKYSLASYDAAYLELALRRQLPLASLDNELRAGAKHAGIKVLGK